MTAAFSYKPRFVDIRIRPPRPERAEAGARRCDWEGCLAPGACRAPKSADRLDEHYMFCPAHAAEYNKSWDFFAGMEESRRKAYEESEATGHRPTWRMGTGARDRDGASRAKTDWARAFSDTFGLFGSGRRREEAAPRARRLGRLETAALETLGLPADSDAETVRTRYTELVKMLHPDANGGDRSSEARLAQVIRAYKTLKKTKLA